MNVNYKVAAFFDNDFVDEIAEFEIREISDGYGMYGHDAAEYIEQIIVSKAMRMADDYSYDDNDGYKWDALEIKDETGKRKTIRLLRI